MCRTLMVVMLLSSAGLGRFFVASFSAATFDDTSGCGLENMGGTVMYVDRVDFLVVVRSSSVVL